MTDPLSISVSSTEMLRNRPVQDLGLTRMLDFSLRDNVAAIMTSANKLLNPGKSLHPDTTALTL